MDKQKDFYSPDEVAELLNLHVRTIRRFIQDGKLEATRIGKQYRITSETLSDFVGSRGVTSQVSPPRRRRRAIVSTTVDIDAIGPDETQRITTMLTGAFGSLREEHANKRLECIYYEEQGQLRIVVNADLATTNTVLGMISGLLDSGQSG